MTERDINSLVIQLTNARHTNVTRAVLNKLLAEHQRELQIVGDAIAQAMRERDAAEYQLDLAKRRIGELTVDLEQLTATPPAD